MAKEERKIVLERTYTVPLRKEWLKTPKWKRTKKAVKALKIFIAKHMKVPERDIDEVKIDSWVNKALWLRGIKKPPHKITVKAIKDSEGNVKVEFVSLPPKFKVQEEFLKKKIEKIKKREAETAKEEEKKLEEEKKAKEEKIEEKKPEEIKEIKETKTEEEKREEKEKKEREKILHKELPKSEPTFFKSQVADGKKEKKEMRRMAMEK